MVICSLTVYTTKSQIHPHFSRSNNQATITIIITSKMWAKVPVATFCFFTHTSVSRHIHPAGVRKCDWECQTKRPRLHTKGKSQNLTVKQQKHSHTNREKAVYLPSTLVLRLVLEVLADERGPRKKVRIVAKKQNDSHVKCNSFPVYQK